MPMAKPADTATRNPNPRRESRTAPAVTILPPPAKSAKSANTTKPANTTRPARPVPFWESLPGLAEPRLKQVSQALTLSRSRAAASPRPAKPPSLAAPVPRWRRFLFRHRREAWFGLAAVAIVGVSVALVGFEVIGVKLAAPDSGTLPTMQITFGEPEPAPSALATPIYGCVKKATAHALGSAVSAGALAIAEVLIPAAALVIAADLAVDCAVGAASAVSAEHAASFWRPGTRGHDRGH